MRIKVRPFLSREPSHLAYRRPSTDSLLLLRVKLLLRAAAQDWLRPVSCAAAFVPADLALTPDSSPHHAFWLPPVRCPALR
jgi:hypothetical protein